MPELCVLAGLGGSVMNIDEIITNGGNSIKN